MVDMSDIVGVSNLRAYIDVYDSSDEEQITIPVKFDVSSALFSHSSPGTPLYSSEATPHTWQLYHDPVT